MPMGGGGISHWLVAVDQQRVVRFGHVWKAETTDFADRSAEEVKTEKNEIA